MQNSYHHAARSNRQLAQLLIHDILIEIVDWWDDLVPPQLVGDSDYSLYDTNSN